MACPACSSIKNKNRVDLGLQIFECRTCGAIHGTCYLGDSYAIVKPWMTTEQVPQDRLRYFDFITIGSRVDRRHGWYDVATGLIVQVG